ncbi:MAG: hypothetical protein L0Z50_01130 [Verrucomicrobiales bacterium]|nr:hypothetical protein [Verrucomicrobiales bacterium]
MRREQLEHIIRAAGAITNQRDIVVVGSQAVLGQFPNAPEELLVSIEADVFPKDSPDLSIQIDGAIGELSPFHQTFGYYAHGVDETTATLPEGWKERLFPIRNENTGGATGWCLEVHDLAVSKLVAGREKDLAFVRGLLKHHLADAKRIGALLPTLATPEGIHELARTRLGRLSSGAT